MEADIYTNGGSTVEMGRVLRRLSTHTNLLDQRHRPALVHRVPAERLVEATSDQIGEYLADVDMAMEAMPTAQELLKRRLEVQATWTDAERKRRLKMAVEGRMLRLFGS